MAGAQVAHFAFSLACVNLNLYKLQVVQNVTFFPQNTFFLKDSPNLLRATGPWILFQGLKKAENQLIYKEREDLTRTAPARAVRSQKSSRDILSSQGTQQESCWFGRLIVMVEFSSVTQPGESCVNQKLQ